MIQFGREPASSMRELTPMMVADVGATRGWAVLFSVLSWIGAALMGTLGCIAVTMGFIMPNGAAIRLVGGICLAGSLLYVPPALWLHRYARVVRRLRSSRSTNDLETALHHEHRFWRFLALSVVISLGVGVVAVGSAMVISALTGRGF